MINRISDWFARARAQQEPAPVPQSNPLWHPTHMHRKGGMYRVIGPAIYEADRSDVVIYDDVDGTVWVRATVEFYDGRFTALRDMIDTAKGQADAVT